MKTLCNEFNKWTEEFQKQTSNDSLSNKPSSTLARYIMHLIYNRAVQDPDKLNHYEPFSPQVYGETSFDLIDQLLKNIKLGENDVFVDLGSGVGNVVLHVAAVTNCKRCYGFEKAEWPAYYAEVRLFFFFFFWMKKKKKNFFIKRKWKKSLNFGWIFWKKILRF